MNRPTGSRWGELAHLALNLALVAATAAVGLTAGWLSVLLAGG